MTNTYTNQTPDQVELAEAIEEHKDAMRDEKYIMVTAIVLYAIGGGLFIFGTNRIETIGLALMLASILAWGIHLFYAAPRELKRRQVVKGIIDRINRKNAIPFYEQLQEKFADDNGVHLHLNDDGTITVTRNKRKEK